MLIDNLTNIIDHWSTNDLIKDEKKSYFFQTRVLLEPPERQNKNVFFQNDENILSWANSDDVFIPEEEL